jgi:hypothetical protein
MLILIAAKVEFASHLVILLCHSSLFSLKLGKPRLSTVIAKRYFWLYYVEI